MSRGSALNPSTTSPQGFEKIGLALFGVGRAGTIHLNYIAGHRKINLLYIVDDDTSKWDAIRDEWNLSNTIFITSAQSSQVFEDSNVLAVVVCSPTYTHEKIVVEALDNNKAVFCEKPIAENLEKTHACYQKARHVGLPLLSAFNRRFDPAYQSVRDRVRKGELGKVLTVKVCSRDSPLPSIDYLKISGGIFHDCAVHDIDMVLHVLGELPTKVSSMANANLPEVAALDDYDTVAIQMTFPSGALAVIDLSRWCNYGYDQRLEVFGKNGMLKVENRQELHNVEKYGPNDVSTGPIDYSFPSRYKRGYEKEMDHFLDVLEGKAKISVTERDTLAVSRIASAAEESARTGKVVEINWSHEKWLQS